MQECADAVRAAARAAGHTEREVHFVERKFDWPSFEGALVSRSLFADRRLVELRLSTPKAADAGADVLGR